eukprot:g3137.t1
MVFSGIVESNASEKSAVVESCEERTDVKLWDGSIGRGFVLTIRSKGFFVDATLGCSIAVNGVCLTVVKWDNDTATFNVAPETCRKTNLNPDDIKPGALVNLERSLSASSRNSGHYVQGHVDGTGVLRSKRMDGDSLWVEISVNDNLLNGLVEKGCICVDGTSLTVVDVNRAKGYFSFMLVPHTQELITLPRKEIGEKINLELDVMGKYAAVRGGSQNTDLSKRVAQLEKAVALLFGSLLCITVYLAKRR